MMGIMQAELQQERQWVSKERFIEGLSVVNMLPGATVVQLGIFLGYARSRNLIVAESNGDCLSEFEIGADGLLTSRRRFAHIGEPDGICLDREGAVWVGAFKRMPSSASIATGTSPIGSRCPAAAWRALWAARMAGRSFASARKRPTRR